MHPHHLSWIQGYHSLAAGCLHKIMRTPSKGDQPLDPFLPGGLLPVGTLHGHTFMNLGPFHLLVFHDGSALLATSGADPKIVPRVLRADVSLAGINTGRAFLEQQAHLLWQEHAAGPNLARPKDTPHALAPPDGSFWSPHDAFPVSAAVFWPGHVAPDPMTEDDVLATLGMFLDLFGDRDRKVEAALLPSTWGNDEVRAVSFQGASFTLPGWVQGMVCDAVPNLAHYVGAAFWEGARATISTQGPPCVSVLPHGWSAHAKLAGRSAWRSHLDDAQARRWARLTEIMEQHRLS